jgi:hypothetical protein
MYWAGGQQKQQVTAAMFVGSIGNCYLIDISCALKGLYVGI